MTTQLPQDRQNDIDRVEMAERAQDMLDEGRHQLQILDSHFLSFFANYLQERTRIVTENIVPAKQVLELPAYSDGQHQAVLRDALHTSRVLSLPEELTLSISKSVLAMSVEAQIQVLGGPGIPTNVELFRVE